VTRSLVRGKHVVCKVTGRDSALVLDDGAVYQENGSIVEVGPFAELAAKYQPDAILGSERQVVMPGMVDAHHHVGLTPFQLGSPDHPLELWFASRYAARNVDFYLDTLYSSFEHLESGVTTVHHLTSRLGPASDWPEAAEKVLKAYQDIGLRVTFSMMVRDQNRLVYGPDDAFVAALPAEIVGDIDAWLKSQTVPLDAYLNLMDDLLQRWGENRAERIRFQLTPANLHWASDETLLRLKVWAADHGTGMHIHVLETAYQSAYAHRRAGVSAVRHLEQIGFLGPEVTLGHGTWLSDDDIAILAATGTRVCHNPSSNLRLQSGIAPLNRLSERGIVTALGIDEAGINDDRDIWQEMRLALKLHRVPGIGARVPTAPEILRMATEHGALTTQFGAEIGTLEPGKAADLVLVDWDSIAQPYLDPSVPVVDALVQRGRAAGVQTAIVAGEVVLQNGRSTRLDKAALMEELAASLRAPLTPAEQRRREVASLLLPHVARFYDGWLDASLASTQQ
jgi:cytosine/adenosine deaminase-related metal-dependent hydrolase